MNTATFLENTATWYDEYKMSPYSVAVKFAQLLHECLTPWQIHRMRVLNKRDQNVDCCHSHDFCDANEVMLDAMLQCGVKVWKDECDFDGDDMEPDAVWTWNRAWEIARNQGMV